MFEFPRGSNFYVSVVVNTSSVRSSVSTSSCGIFIFSVRVSVTIPIWPRRGNGTCRRYHPNLASTRQWNLPALPSQSGLDDAMELAGVTIPIWPRRGNGTCRRYHPNLASTRQWNLPALPSQSGLDEAMELACIHLYLKKTFSTTELI